ncbi:hypothetical protein MAR_020906 [Mya arenaria]|uniref:Uncharacterized protein n=1 Tax=Mya arenaria TaxID=6604 RepID=A0ABY7E9A8_MYAAR|nr:hypothetical protein MAR_020906 [Mya arenaria]
MSRAGERHQVLTPALEGSKSIVPQNARIPLSFYTPAPGKNRMYGSPLPYYPALPPVGGYGVPYGGYGYSPQMIPSDRMAMPRPRPFYQGPQSLMPWWGGHSMQGQYYPGPIAFTKGSIQMKVKPGSRQAIGRQVRQVIPVPIRIPRKVPPPQPVIVHQPPPPLCRSGRGFWHAAVAAWFIAHLRKNLTNRPSSMFLFGIILKEIVAALHRIYLNPNGNIYPVLNDVIGPNCYDLAELIHGGRGLGGKEESVLIQELQYVLENLVYHITEIMPSTGVLGTHRKSAVFELIRSGKRFPDGYFWQVEMDRLQFTDQGRTVNVGDTEGFLLMLGIFISRSLVTTILMKPMDYGLSNSPLSEVAERNLRVVATTLLYLVRRISIARGHGIMPVPTEIAEYLYTDEEMDYIYSKLARTFNYSEGLLREWGTEYTRRLRGSSMQT